MAAFLHKVPQNRESVARLVSQRECEDEKLEFKAKVWDAEEFAKDVSAFANHLGGDIVIGVSEHNDCAEDWVFLTGSEIKLLTKSLRDWMIKHLLPHAFAEVVVSVPASPDLIAVEVREGDRYSYRFPVRTGRQIRCLVYEEIMNRTDAGVRRQYLQLAAVARRGFNSVRFASPVAIAFKDMLVGLEIGTGSHGILEKFDESTFTVRMSAGEGRTEVSTPVGAPLPLVLDVPKDQRLTLPFEIVRAIWIDTSVPDVLDIAVEGSIIWNGFAWTLNTQV
jgi:hypothetical protein